MVNFTYDYSFLIKTLKYILLPVIVIVAIVGFCVFMYSRKSKNDNIEKYNYIIDLWTTLIAIFVVGALFAITLGFSLSLTNTIKAFDLIKGHEFIYYLVLMTPFVPFIFLLIYIYKFILTLANKPKEEKESRKEEINKVEEIEEEKEDDDDTDYHIDFTKFNESQEQDDDVEELLDAKEEKEEETLSSDTEEILDLTDTSDEEEEIELL